MDASVASLPPSSCGSGPTLGAGGDGWDGSASADDLGAEELSYLRPNVQLADADRQEVVMSPTVTSLDQIDYDISVAYIALGVARGSFDRCPSSENARAVEEAETRVDRLLDERFAVQQ
jgi:hypothetical protein